MLRSTRRGLETWHGRDRVTLADERARQQGTQTSTYTGAPVLDPTCEGGRVRFPSATRRLVGGWLAGNVCDYDPCCGVDASRVGVARRGHDGKRRRQACC